MRTAIVYASVHHGNTEKLVKRIAEECQVDLIDAVIQPDADLSSYDMIGFASGIYFSKFHQSILEFAEKNLPNDKKIFLICTYGGSANYKSIEQILDKKRSKVIGKFGCKGYDTFGPFKLVGGIAKGHPDCRLSGSHSNPESFQLTLLSHKPYTAFTIPFYGQKNKPSKSLTRDRMTSAVPPQLTA